LLLKNEKITKDTIPITRIVRARVISVFICIEPKITSFFSASPVILK